MAETQATENVEHRLEDFFPKHWVVDPVGVNNDHEFSPEYGTGENGS